MKPRTNCIICRKKLTDKKNKKSSLTCGGICRKTYLRVFNQLYYRGNKDYFKNYMKGYYEENKEDLRESSKINRHSKSYDYDKERKNNVRDNIISLLEGINIKNILTLESPKFLFSKKLPEKKIIVFENSESEFKKMKENKPKNVSLFLGDISEFAYINSAVVDMVYLDFCCTYESAKEEIFLLKPVINKSKLFAVTFCVRGGVPLSEKIGDYQFDLINKIQKLTETNWKVLYGEGYRDSSSMVTILFENPNKEKIE